MSTAIATWGNSEAVRIPRDVLRAVGLHKGDRVSLAVNDRGNIEIVPERAARANHRCVAPARGVTYETLFAGYDRSAPEPSRAIAEQPAWPDDDLAGAEYRAWCE